MTRHWQDDVHDWRDSLPLANPIILGRAMVERLALSIEHDTTFFEIDLSEDARWLALGIKPDDLLALRRVIDHFHRMEQKDIDDRHKTVFWDDGDHGSEFITPEEYHRRIKVREEAPTTEVRGGWRGLVDRLRSLTSPASPG